MLQEEGVSLLLDLSSGTLDRMVRHLPLHELDGVIISHLHLDHCADLATLVFALNHLDYPRGRGLPLLGPPGLLERMEGLRKLYGSWLDEPGCGLPITEWRGALLQELGFRFEAAAVAHSASGHGWRIESPSGASLAYSGDTGPSRALIDLARGADLLLCECTQPEGRPAKGHLMPSQVGEIAAKALVAQVLLTHFSCEARVDEALAICNRRCGLRVRAAVDGERYVVGC